MAHVFVHNLRVSQLGSHLSPFGLWGESEMALSVQRKGPEKATQHIDFCEKNGMIGMILGWFPGIYIYI